MYDEILDLVNEQDEVIGQKSRAELYRDNVTNFRVVNAFIQNDNGQLWIPRRTQFKRIFPLCLDASMGGHVEAGETYEQAFARETMEELRIDITSISYQEIGALTPHQHGTAAFMRVFLIKSNEVPNYNPEDFVESFWLTPQGLLERLESGEKAKGDLSKMVKYFFV